MTFLEVGDGYFGLDWAWYTGDQEYDFWLAFGFVYSVCVGLGCMVFATPYGKFADDRFGLELDPRLGWWLMELPATLSFLYFYPKGSHSDDPLRMFFAALWFIHYGNRGWYFPLTIRVAPGRKSSFSIVVASLGMAFTTFHAYLNAKWFGEFANISPEWFCTPQFIVGFLIYELSFLATLQSERIVRDLRDPKKMKKGDPRYKIPYGGLFKYVTSPAYFGELAGWLGWAIMTMNPGGAVVFLVSSANLVPRAFASQQWYNQKFEDYPKDRKVLIPFLL